MKRKDNRNQKQINFENDEIERLYLKFIIFLRFDKSSG